MVPVGLPQKIWFGAICRISAVIMFPVERLHNDDSKNPKKKWRCVSWFMQIRIDHSANTTNDRGKRAEVDSGPLDFRRASACAQVTREGPELSCGGAGPLGPRGQ